MVIDGDGDKTSLNEFIQGMTSENRRVSIESVVGQHVAVIESRIRRIKERIRAHISVLPFRLTKRSMAWLVTFVVYRYNCLPIGDETDGITPRHRFTGNKPDYKKDLSLGFGDYVQALVPSNNSIARNAVDDERTEGAIALYPVGGTAGGWKFLRLKKGTLVTRYHWTVLPMSVEVVERFENLTEVHYSDGYQKQVEDELDGKEVSTSNADHDDGGADDTNVNRGNPNLDLGNTQNDNSVSLQSNSNLTSAVQGAVEDTVANANTNTNEKRPLSLARQIAQQALKEFNECLLGPTCNLNAIDLRCNRIGAQGASLLLPALAPERDRIKEFLVDVTLRKALVPIATLPVSPDPFPPIPKAKLFTLGVLIAPPV
jgi:hypothetical protein